ncbi:MAG: helix-turn-helix domain-containing protein [Coriobacteriia bacterium]
MQNLGRIIGENLRRLRSESGLSLDALARISGVSKSRLGQIEQGEANPSVTTVWQIASALRVEFSALVTTPRADSEVVRQADVVPVTADEGRYRVYPLFPFDPALGYEVYRAEIDPAGQLHAGPHPDGTWETVVVSAGHLSIEVAGERQSLGAGDAVRFKADVAHGYRNAGDEVVACSFVITYPRVG